jgi:hypothetical protein
MSTSETAIRPETDDHRAVAEVLARYVRAADHRDPDSMAAIYTGDAVVEIYYSGAGQHELLAELRGAEKISAAVVGGMAPHPELGWSHHTMDNPIATVEGDHATYDVQFIVYSVRGTAPPYPDGASGAQGTITPIESGYYFFSLRRDRGRWKIAHQVIKHDLRYVFPAA